MKSSLSLILGLCAVMSVANAQTGGNDRGRFGRGDRGNVLYIEANVIENQAIQKLENSLAALRNELQLYNNNGYGNGGYGQRGQTTDIIPYINSIDFSVQELRRLVKGNRETRNNQLITNQLNSLSVNGLNLVLATSTIRRGTTSKLVDEIFAVTKAIGGIEVAMDAPRLDLPNNGQSGYNGGRPRADFGRSAYCSLSYVYSYNNYLVSGEGLDISDALAKLYTNCAKANGSATCQSKISQAVCVDAFEFAAQQDPGYTRFATCTMTYNYSFNSYIVNGAGTNLVAAIGSLWDACSNANGSATCRNGIANTKFSCTVR